MSHSNAKPAPGTSFLLPAPGHGGGWSTHPTGVGSAALWLRNLLKNTVTRGDVALGTHSCKATLLSWMSKRGLPHGPRRLLGYHVSKGDNSLVIYSRDAMASPLRLMCSMLKEVKNDLFRPDVTRSGMLVTPGAPNPKPQTPNPKP